MNYTSCPTTKCHFLALFPIKNNYPKAFAAWRSESWNAAALLNIFLTKESDIPFNMLKINACSNVGVFTLRSHGQFLPSPTVDNYIIILYLRNAILGWIGRRQNQHALYVFWLTLQQPWNLESTLRCCGPMPGPDSQWWHAWPVLAAIWSNPYR